eukprot:SAG31_NODE_50_length_30520_cov_89.906712_20_plen_169_part_00
MFDKLDFRITPSYIEQVFKSFCGANSLRMDLPEFDRLWKHLEATDEQVSKTIAMPSAATQLQQQHRADETKSDGLLHNMLNAVGEIGENVALLWGREHDDPSAATCDTTTIWIPNWRRARKCYDRELETVMDEQFHTWRPFEKWYSLVDRIKSCHRNMAAMLMSKLID